MKAIQRRSLLDEMLDTGRRRQLYEVRHRMSRVGVGEQEAVPVMDPDIQPTCGKKDIIG